MIGAKLICLACGAAAIAFSGITKPAFGEIRGGAPASRVHADSARGAWIPAGRIILAQTKNGVDRKDIEEIQRLLTEHGLDPGSADGNLGPKTSLAIGRYQKSAGLVTDGLPSRELLDHLRKPAGDASGSGSVSASVSDTAEAAPVAEVETAQTSDDPPPPPPPMPSVPSLTNTAWRFIDDSGSKFTLTFGTNYVVEGVLYEQFWNWRQIGNDVTIVYDNGMGLQVTRTGTLISQDAMSGSANDSRGGAWTWSAARIPQAGQ